MPQIGDIKRERVSIGNGKRHSRQFIWNSCRRCGKQRWIRCNKRYEPMSTFCRSCGCKITGDKNKAENNQNWKGGTRRSGGYVLQRIFPEDFFWSMAKGDGYVMEHRLVMAKYLSRCLLPWEVVHHKNGVKDDNRIENLELLTDGRYHLVDMKTKRYIVLLEQKIRRLESQLLIMDRER